MIKKESERYSKLDFTTNFSTQYSKSQDKLSKVNTYLDLYSSTNKIPIIPKKTNDKDLVTFGNSKTDS